MSIRVLSLPGWTNSGPQHWQTLWERLDSRIVRVQQANWDQPNLSAWIAAARAALERSPEPTVLLGHSLGALLIAHVAPSAPNVVGALLVAPPDLHAPSTPPELRGFRAEFGRLPFPATMIVSHDDPHSTIAASRLLARTLGAELIDAGAKGHLNTASNLGTWRAGWEQLRLLRARAPFHLDPRLEADSQLIGRGSLSDLRLVDDARYLWCLLVPRRSGIEELDQLDDEDRATLSAESICLATAMRSAFDLDKLNVGTLGNVVRQLHLHHVGRTLDDPAWPGPVWGHSERVPMTAGVMVERRRRLFRVEQLSSWFSEVG